MNPYSYFSKSYQPPTDDYLFLIKLFGLLFVAPFAFWVWYHLIGKGIKEKGIATITISDKDIIFEMYSSKTILKFENIKEFRVKGKMHKTIEIVSTNKNDLIIDYYLFSRAQRENIFKELNGTING